MQELHTLDMTYPVCWYLNNYLNVPGGNTLEYNEKLIRLVKALGAKYGEGKGSNLSKGIRYIYYNTKSPSKRQIKMMLRNVSKALIHKDDVISEYVYRCSKHCFAEVFGFILDKMDISNDVDTNLADILMEKQMMGIRFVAANPPNEKIQNEAIKLLRTLEKY